MAQWAKSVVGQTLKETYRVERLLGVGGMGAVYAARHVRTGAQCAVKVLHRRAAEGAAADGFKRFQEEARIIAALHHPHIVAVFDMDRDMDRDSGGVPFLVMELLEGESLHVLLQKQGALPLSQVVELAAQAGSALSAAHQRGVLHRNVKPENIFVQRYELGDRPGLTVKLGDFGLHRLRRALLPKGGPPSAEERTLLGLSQYMAPEALKERGATLDVRADQWSLAVVLYRVLSGRLPFEGNSVKDVLRQVLCEEPLPLSQLAPELPEHVVSAITRALSRHKEERFPGMLDFVRALQGRSSAVSAILATAPPVSAASTAIREAAPPVSVPLPVTARVEPPQRVMSSRPPWGLLAGGLLLAVLLGGGSKILIKRHRSVSAQRALTPAPVPAVHLAVPALPGSPHWQASLALPPSLSAAPPMEVLHLPAQVPRVEPPPAGIATPAVLPAPPRPVQQQAAEEPEQEQPAPAPPPPALPTMQDAQEAYAAGDRQRAVQMAQQIAEHGQDRQAAWRFLGTAACALNDTKLAGRAYRHLAPDERQFVVSICQQKGLAYLNGQFQPDN